jgi:phosphatidylinositol alpha 1,6-mannosyltransferase
MDATRLRIALFSGNYNYIRDGANQALNRLVGYLLRQGAQVRVYSATTDTPAFPPTGDLVSVKSVKLPGGRGEYRAALGITPATRRDIEAFNPNIFHVAAPDYMGHRAITYARKRGLPILASMHTRFETYPRYYGLAFMEPAMLALLRRFYRRCDAVVAPSESMAQVMREQRLSYDIGIWTRGIDTSIFNPTQRDLDWRRGLGIEDDEVVIGFLGRLVMEKGLDVFSDSIDALRRRGVPHRVMVIGDGPARDWFEKRLPGAVFVGQQSGADLGRAAASMDLLFNPSVTETFGNVTLEVMACGLPVLAARATGSASLVRHGITGTLVRPGAISDFADALEAYCTTPALRAAHGGAGLAESARYDWDRVNQAVVDTYIRLIRQRNGEAPAVPTR